MTNLSKKILTRLAAALVVFIAVLAWKAAFLKEVFLGEQATTLSLSLNGFILLLFASGILKIVAALRHYAEQDRQVDLFINAKQTSGIEALDASQELSVDSVIYSRYSKIKDLHGKQIPINHGALSSIMLAEESLYVSYPRFVNNVLILTGVFGTIVSLILALAGAGAVLKTSVAGKGMWMIINGMNTALTTTGVAIICYFFFTYFYQKLLDAQTLFFSKVEDATLMYIVPEFRFDPDAVNHKIERMIRNIMEFLETFGERVPAEQMPTLDLEEITGRLNTLQSLLELGKRQAGISEEIADRVSKLDETMKKGFRLEE